MKSTKFLVLALLLSVGLLSSCKKDQTAYNKLAGKWKLERLTLDGFMQEVPPSFVMLLTFGDCDAGSTCSLVTSQSTDGGAHFSEDTENFTLSSDGKKIIKDDGSITIDKLTKTNLQLSSTDDNSSTTIFELKKQ